MSSHRKSIMYLITQSKLVSAKITEINSAHAQGGENRKHFGTEENRFWGHLKK